MTGHHDELINFVSKFISTVRFGNDHFAAIMGYEDLQMGNILISRVYYVEGLGYNLFSIGQFCDSDLEVAFKKHTCFVSNLEGVDLLSGSRGSNLYTISMMDMMKSSPICLLSKASKTKSWLWHRCLSHLNFSTINQLAKQGLVKGLPKLKYTKDHLTKDEAPEILIKFLKQTQVSLNATVRYLRTNNGTKFINQTLRNYTKEVGITHHTSTAHTPQQNGVVERHNHTLVEAARTMLIFSKFPLFLWAGAVATACYTQNRSLIHTRYTKTPYELLRDRKPELKYLHVFGALCYPTNDFGKLQPKGVHWNLHRLFTNQKGVPDLQQKDQINNGNNERLPMFDEYFKPPSDVSTLISTATLPLPDTTGTSSSTSINKDAPYLSTSPNNETTTSLINSINVEQPHNEEVLEFDSDTFTNPFAPPVTSSAESSSRIVDTSNMHTFQQPYVNTKR
ncbi:retrovirus-related pol polyprotein from transposon TNT 1-94 [Tanacetum coccineum]